MNAPARIAVFVLGLAAFFGVALVVGNQVGPVGGQAADASDPGSADAGSGHGHSESGDLAEPGHGDQAGSAGVPGGLMVSSGDYTLALQTPAAQPGRDRRVAFLINGPDGGLVTEYDVEHEKRLHFIAVRRDFSGFQHVHPELGPDGTWTAALDLTPGQWRVFADFKPAGGDSLTLGSDLLVPGRVAAAADRPPIRVSTVDGYTVTLTGDLVPGEHSMLELSIAKDGVPVTDLQPYLGAYGHLVALRGGDLAYLHVHPDGEPGDGKTKPGPAVEFGAEVPSVGTYHLYLDFQHDGVVRTAQFALAAGQVPGQGHDHD